MKSSEFVYLAVIITMHKLKIFIGQPGQGRRLPDISHLQQHPLPVAEIHRLKGMFDPYVGA